MASPPSKHSLSPQGSHICGKYSEHKVLFAREEGNGIQLKAKELALVDLGQKHSLQIR